MGTPPKPPDAGASPRRRFLPLIVSGLVHLAVLGFWATVPDTEPQTQADLDLRPVEWMELPAPVVVEPEPVVPEPPPPPSQDEPPPTPEQSEPATPPPNTPREPDNRRGDPAEPGTATPGAEPSAEATTPPASPSTGGIALLGLRNDSQTARPSGSLRPSLPPPAAGSSQTRQAGSSFGPPPSGRDGQPRSLAEAGFVRKRSGKMVYVDRASGFKATLRPDGRVKFRATVTPSSMPGMSEIIRSAQGTELFQAQKKRLLEQTFDLRLQMAVNYARDKLDRRLKGLYRELLDQWSKGTKTVEQRKAQLFERWDECEEGLRVKLPGFEGADASELDEARKAGGQQARETIERFIRRQLPVGSEDAYTAAELQRFNAKRHSQARFDPYH